MTRKENDLDEYGKRALAHLRTAPPLDSKSNTEEKARFLLQAENLRMGLIPNMPGVQPTPVNRKPGIFRGKLSLNIYKALAITILVLLFVMASSFTVYAAQSSLPGEPLYSIKSLSEDIRLSITISPKAKLDLTLDYTNRRVNEMKSLVSNGKPLPDQISDRYQIELEDVLVLAAQMDDQQIQHALVQIKAQAQDQGMTVEELIAILPHQASPAIIHLQERLQEQIQLSTIGEQNPQQFRKEVQQREHKRQGPKKSTSDEPGSLPTLGTVIPMPNQDNDDNGNGKNHPTQAPNQGNQGNGQGQSTPGNGNHSP